MIKSGVLECTPCNHGYLSEVNCIHWVNSVTVYRAYSRRSGVLILVADGSLQLNCLAISFLLFPLGSLSDEDMFFILVRFPGWYFHLLVEKQ